MKSKFIENEIKYTGAELAPHRIYRNQKIQGDAIVAFIGECDVKLTEMVDIEDVINNEPIYSKKMLSFICEIFNINLPEVNLQQHEAQPHSVCGHREPRHSHSLHSTVF